MSLKKEIDVLIDPPEIFAGKERWQHWRDGLNKAEPEIPAITAAIREADEVLRWYEQQEIDQVATA